MVIDLLVLAALLKAYLVILELVLATKPTTELPLLRASLLTSTPITISDFSCEVTFQFNVILQSSELAIIHSTPTTGLTKSLCETAAIFSCIPHTPK